MNFVAFATASRAQLRWAIAVIAVAAIVVPPRSGAQIAVGANTEGNTGGANCSLQEAIYGTEFGSNIALDQTDPDDTYYTGCLDPSGAWNVIDLPGGTLTFTKFWDGDAHNPFGPTATPIIFKAITIRGHGTTLLRTGSDNFRLFAVGQAIIPYSGQPLTGVVSGSYSGTGDLTLQDVHIQNFHVKGGDGGEGGGGGLGGGGAIYVGKVSSGTPNLTVVNSTFESNSAVGGNGAGINVFVGGDGSVLFSVSGGGGGLNGNGGKGGGFFGGGSAGGGGGGARGSGGNGDFGGGGGGGTVFDGALDGSTGIGGPGGLYCGGNGGDGSSGGNSGHDGKCAGGGGGGGGEATNPSNPFGGQNGGDGTYGGGGGGAPDSGGNGGFGGGGGGGSSGGSCTNCVATYGGGNGGNGGFAGGGGTGFSSLSGGGPGSGGKFGGNAIGAGGGGGALGGAIFNDSGTVTVQNSTFFNNSVTRGVGGSDQFGGIGDNGADGGGAIFSRNGSTAVQDVTISGNQATGAGGGIVVVNDGATTTLILQNTIIANNGNQECIVQGTVATSSSGVNSAANLIVNNSATSGSQHPCPQATVTSDPKLDLLKPNLPGDTPTMALLSGSPAIGAADSGTSLSTDQRGVTRKATPDIGAYETVPEADLQVKKSVSSSTAKAGDLVTYTLSVTNLGPDDATTVTVTDSLPAELTYSSCTVSTGGSCSSQGGTFSSLAANASATITLSGTLNSGLTRGMVVTNTASVQASSPDDPVSANNSDSASFTVIVPDFTLSAVTPITIPVGGSGTSALTIGSVDTFSSAVSLSTTGPSSFHRSFNPNPGTPPSNGSTISTLTVALEPSVVAGSYTVNETGTSGALSHGASVTVNVQTTIAGIANVISGDLKLGAIDNAGVATALISKLAVAQSSQTAGQTQTEINTLQALLSQINAQTGKHIKTAWLDGTGQAYNPAGVLVGDVTDLLVNAGANLKATPIIGNVVSTTGTGLSGLTVNLLNSKNVMVANAATDATGFYYFPVTSGLTSGANYSVRVTVPKAYKNSTPSAQSFTWKAASVSLNTFVLN